MPGLFIVPTMAFSPCSTGFAVTTPSIGDTIVVFFRLSLFPRRFARACSIRRSSARSFARAESRRELRLLEVLLGLDLRLVVLLRPLEVALGLLARELVRLALGEEGVERGLRGLRVRVVLGLVDLEKEVPLLDLLPLDDRERHDLPHHLGGDVDLDPGPDAAVAAHRRHEGYLRDLRGRDLRRVLVPGLDRRHDDDGEKDGDPDSDRPLDPAAHERFSLRGGETPGSCLYLIRDSGVTGFRLNGGGGGIRTPGTLRFSGFQDRRLKPLGHSSGALLR